MQTQTLLAAPTRLLRLSAWSALSMVLLAVVLFGLIRYRLRDMPLERDEGEYAYSGQLLLQGIPPYELAYNMKFPGIYVAYAGMLAAFGETPAGIHLGFLLVNAATVFLLYFLTSVLLGRLAAVVSGCSYALLSTSISVMGFEAHATNFVVLPALLGILLLFLASRSGRSWLFFLSGLCAGIAILMKQHGMFFALFCFLNLIWSDWNRKLGAETILRRAAAFASGVILPYVTTCWVLYRAGVFRQFWFWTVSYAGEYSKMGLRRGVRVFLENSRTVASPALPVWILAAAGMSALLWSRSARRRSGFIGGFFLFSFLALCPGAYFRPHYFVLLLPATAILTGIAVSSATEKLAEHSKLARLVLIPVLVFGACLGYSIFEQRQVYFSMDALAVVQATYGVSAFAPAMEMADYIRNNSPETARIAVLGSEPEIYFYAKRHSATGYLYMYSMIEQQKYSARLREGMMRELEANRPDYLVYVDVWDSWGDRDGPQAAGFLAWLQEYMNENYERVGVADIGDQTRYVWGAAAKTYVVVQPLKGIYVLKRKQFSSIPNHSPRGGARYLFDAYLRCEKNDQNQQFRLDGMSIARVRKRYVIDCRIGQKQEQV
jgi:4-amino-4-deoxy-L-arabinose transferase-like glycosyltransferase